MTKETLTTKRKLEILKEFGDFWKEMAQYYLPERIEAAILLGLYETFMEEEGIEDWTKGDLVKTFEDIFSLDYIDELIEKRCKTKQDVILLHEGIGFAWGLLNEEEDIYEAIDNTKSIMELVETKSNKKDLSELFNVIYGVIEKEKDKEEIEKIKENIRGIYK